MSLGFFITFEGGEGAGKSTQIKRLRDTLVGKGYNVVQTREPGGTPEAEKVRDLLVQRDGGEWSAREECLLLY
ncbi:MAG TPA: dTMP kinase, partial [Alphaproteobacteria bacterium]|nr:dTMP kinase [Alphaproteobacteria bacterium]